MQHPLKKVDLLERNIFSRSGIHKMAFGVASSNSGHCLFMVLTLNSKKSKSIEILSLQLSVLVVAWPFFFPLEDGCLVLSWKLLWFILLYSLGYSIWNVLNENARHFCLKYVLASSSTSAIFLPLSLLSFLTFFFLSPFPLLSFPPPPSFLLFIFEILSTLATYLNWNCCLYLFLPVNYIEYLVK